jgi:hypothetical protein
VATMCGPTRFIPVPATLPLTEAVDRLNAIQPRSVSTTSEQLTADDRAIITAAFSVPVVNQSRSWSTRAPDGPRSRRGRDRRWFVRRGRGGPCHRREPPPGRGRERHGDRAYRRRAAETSADRQNPAVHSAMKRGRTVEQTVV